MKTHATLFLLSLVLATGCVTTHDEAARNLLSVSAGGDKKLVLYDFDSQTGALKPKREIELPGAPGPQCLSPDGNRLYVSIRGNNSVAVYDIDHANAAIKHIATTSIGQNAAYIATDRTGKTLLWASYGGGKVGSHKVGPNGAVVEGAISEFETARCAHAILVDATNRHVFVPHTCPNAVYQFHFDAATGKLTPNPQQLVKPAEGLEPRHLAFHPTLPVIYFDDEKGDSVTAYQYDRDLGTVKPFQTTSTLPANFNGDMNSCADIEITRDGGTVYASNRGHNSIAAFKVNPADGRLTVIGQFKTGNTPRSFNLSPGNQWLIAAGQRSHDLHTYRRHSNGKLTSTGDPIPTGQGPAWVQFIPLK